MGLLAIDSSPGRAIGRRSNIQIEVIGIEENTASSH